MRTQARRLSEDFMTRNRAMGERHMDSGKNVSDYLIKTLLENQEKEDPSWAEMCFIIAVFTTCSILSVSASLMLFIASHSFSAR
jgi:hypothetical protein